MNSDDLISFSKEHFNILAEVSQLFFDEIPSFKEIHNPAFMRIGLHNSDILENLIGYIKSLEITCEQGLYAIERLRNFSSHESSNITEFYVAHYLNDFIVRVKTGTDLLALIINNIYKLGLYDKQCSLENDLFVKKIREKMPNSPKAEQIAKEIDKIRTTWLSVFDDLRDLAVHRAGFEFISVTETGYPIHIYLRLPKGQKIPFNPKSPTKALRGFAQENSLAKFLVQIKSKSVSEYLVTINPILFCDEVWNLWSKSTENILSICKEDILAQF